MAKELTKIRDLTIKHVDKPDTHAEYLLDEYGMLWFKEDGKESVKGYQRRKWTCESCKHNCSTCIKTNNDAYVCRPLPPNVSKCERLKGREERENFDITFSCKANVCEHFEPKHNYAEWNINQFIDVKNCCSEMGLGKKLIQGFSYKDKQIPFSFYITSEDFLLGVAINHKITMYKPLLWDSFNIDGQTYRGADNYIKLNNITDKNLRKEIKEAFSHADASFPWHYNGRIFNLDTMWFDAE